MGRPPTARKGHERDHDNELRRLRYEDPEVREKIRQRNKAWRQAHANEVNAARREARRKQPAKPSTVTAVVPFSYLSEDAQQEAALALLEGKDPAVAVKKFWKQETQWQFMDHILPSSVTGIFREEKL